MSALPTPPTSPPVSKTNHDAFFQVDAETPRAPIRPWQALYYAEVSENIASAGAKPSLRTKRSIGILSPLRNRAASMASPSAPSSPRRKRTPTTDVTPTAATHGRTSRIHSPRFYESLKMRWRPATLMTASSFRAAVESSAPLFFNPGEAEPLPSPPTPLADDVSNAFTALHALPSPHLPSPTNSTFFRRDSSVSSCADSPEGGMAGVGAGAAARRAMLKGGNFWEQEVARQLLEEQVQMGGTSGMEHVPAPAKPTLVLESSNFVAPRQAPVDRDSLAYLLPSAVDSDAAETGSSFAGRKDDRDDDFIERLRASPPRLGSAWSSDSPFSGSTPSRSRPTSDALDRSRSTDDAPSPTILEGSKASALPEPLWSLRSGALTPEMDWSQQMLEIENRWSGVLEKKRDSVQSARRRSSRSEKRSSVASASRISTGTSKDRSSASHTKKPSRNSLPPRLSLPPIAPLVTEDASHRKVPASPFPADPLTTVWEAFVSAADISATDPHEVPDSDSSAAVTALQERWPSLETKEGEVVEALLMMQAPVPASTAPLRGLGIDVPSLAGLEGLGSLVDDGVPSLPDLPRSRASRDLSILTPTPIEISPKPPVASTEFLPPLPAEEGDDCTGLEPALVAAFPSPPAISPKPRRVRQPSGPRSPGQTKSAPLRSGPQRPAPPRFAPPPVTGPLNPDGRPVLAFSSRADKSSRAAAPAPLQLVVTKRASMPCAPLTPPPSAPLPPAPLGAMEKPSPDLPALPAPSPDLPTIPAASLIAVEQPAPSPKLPSLPMARAASASPIRTPFSHGVKTEVVARPARVTSLFHGGNIRLNSSFPPPPLPSRTKASEPVMRREILPSLPLPKAQPSPQLTGSSSTLATSIFSLRPVPDTPASSIFDHFLFSPVPKPLEAEDSVSPQQDEVEEVSWGMAL